MPLLAAVRIEDGAQRTHGIAARWWLTVDSINPRIAASSTLLCFSRRGTEQQGHDVHPRRISQSLKAKRDFERVLVAHGSSGHERAVSARSHLGS